MSGRGRPRATVAKKVAWLIKNHLTTTMPRDPDRNELKALVNRMKKAGLIAPTTYWVDVHPRQLLDDARALEVREDSDGF